MKVWVWVIFFTLAASVSLEAKILEMSPPKSVAIKKNQLYRADEIKTNKRLGYIGEADSGYLMIHEADKIPKEKKQKVEELVNIENKDRKMIYEEIIKFNKLKNKEIDIFHQSSFEAYKNADPKGTFYFEKMSWHKKY